VLPLLQWKSNKYCIFWVCVCGFRYLPCNVNKPLCHLWPLRHWHFSTIQTKQPTRCTLSWKKYFIVYSCKRCSTYFGKHFAHHQEHFWTAVATSGFHIKAEVDVFPAVVCRWSLTSCHLRHATHWLSYDHDKTSLRAVCSFSLIKIWFKLPRRYSTVLFRNFPLSHAHFNEVFSGTQHCQDVKVLRIFRDGVSPCKGGETSHLDAAVCLRTFHWNLYPRML
jgi:hypothetical protein